MSTDPLTEYRSSVMDAPAGVAAGDEVPATIVCEPLTDDPDAANWGAFAVRLKRVLHRRRPVQSLDTFSSTRKASAISMA